MTLENKIDALVSLGNFLRQFKEDDTREIADVKKNSDFFEPFKDLIQLSQSHNGWYTQEQVYFALNSWAEALTEENLRIWLSRYDFIEKDPKTVAIILAGNIPLVGFHDFLSVLISGNKVLVKTSSNDQHLLPFLAKYLIAVEPKFENYIEFTEGKLQNYDAVIATGSDNTARYFEFYFKDKPSIIRKNRNAVAVLSGNESEEQMQAVGEDSFRYFGLGCRNVSKLFVPEGYNFDKFFEGIFSFQDIVQYERYANNYDYNKAVFLMSNFKLLDNGFLTIKEDESYSSPISSVFYEYYESIDELNSKLKNDDLKIQCVVSDGIIENGIPFGETQKPKLWDYADNVDTIEFLIKL